MCKIRFEKFVNFNGRGSLRAPIRLPPGGGSRQRRVEEPACKSFYRKLPSAHNYVDRIYKRNFSFYSQTDVRSNFLSTPHPSRVASHLPPLGKANCASIPSSYRTLCAQNPFFVVGEGLAPPATPLCARTPFPHLRSGATIRLPLRVAQRREGVE